MSDIPDGTGLPVQKLYQPPGCQVRRQASCTAPAASTGATRKAGPNMYSYFWVSAAIVVREIHDQGTHQRRSLKGHCGCLRIDVGQQLLTKVEVTAYFAFNLVAIAPGFRIRLEAMNTLQGRKG